MKKKITIITLLISFSALAQVEVQTSNDNKMFLKITSTGSDGQETCDGKISELVSKLEKAGRIVLSSSMKCKEEYKYEHKDGPIARYNGLIVVLK